MGNSRSPLPWDLKGLSIETSDSFAESMVRSLLDRLPADSLQASIHKRPTLADIRSNNAIGRTVDASTLIVDGMEVPPVSQSRWFTALQEPVKADERIEEKPVDDASSETVHVGVVSPWRA